MLLSREAIAEVVENLDPDHFYKPAHGHLYDAIMGLYGAGQPVDVVTVAEELASGPASSRRSVARPSCSTSRPPPRPSATPGTTPRSSRSTPCSGG